MKADGIWCCPLDVWNDVVVEPLLDESIVVLHVRGDNEVCLKYHLGELKLVKQHDKLILLSMRNVDKVFDTEHQHDRHNCSLNL